MFRCVVLMAVLTVLACGIACHREASRIHDNHHNAGTIFDDGRELVHTFSLVNTKPQVIDIVNISKSCTCTSVQVDKMKLSPGESASIVMHINPSRSKGTYKVLGTLHTSDNLKTHEYVVEYSIIPHIAFEAPSVNLGLISSKLDSLEESVSPSKSIWLELNQTTEKAISPIVTVDATPPIVAQIQSEGVTKDLASGKIRQTRYRIETNVDLGSLQSFPSGIHSSILTARSSTGESASATVLWSLDTPLIAAPNPISFGVVKSSDTAIVRRIVISTRDKVPFHVLAIESQPAGVELDEEGTAKEQAELYTTMHTVQIAIRPSMFDTGFPNGFVKILTDHPSQKDIKIAWSAILANRP